MFCAVRPHRGRKLREALAAASRRRPRTVPSSTSKALRVSSSISSRPSSSPPCASQRASVGRVHAGRPALLGTDGRVIHADDLALDLDPASCRRARRPTRCAWLLQGRETRILAHAIAGNPRSPRPVPPGTGWRCPRAESSTVPFKARRRALFEHAAAQLGQLLPRPGKPSTGRRRRRWRCAARQVAPALTARCSRWDPGPRLFVRVPRPRVPARQGQPGGLACRCSRRLLEMAVSAEENPAPASCLGPCGQAMRVVTGG